MSQLFASSGQSIEVSASASVLPMNIQDWFPLGGTGLISLQSKGLLRIFSPTPQLKSMNSSALSFLYGPSDFIFLGSKITTDGDCSHEIKRCLLLERKAMINLDHILKSRDITLLTKAHLVKTMVFPVVVYECERWTIKKAEHWRTDAFELWCWRRLSIVPWTARRSN